MLIAALIIIVVLLVLASVFSISDNLIQIEAQKQGIDTSKKNLSIYPKLSELFAKPTPPYVDKSRFHRLTKGRDILLSGMPGTTIVDAEVSRFGVKPTDFRGIAPIPKVEVEEGSEVLAGDALFFDKSNPNIKYVSPVSGELVEIRRGAKRSISHLVILADREQQYKKFDVPSLHSSREEISSFLQASGVWPMILQRPFDVIADPENSPENIFISCFDTAPLAIGSQFILNERSEDFQMAIDVLNKLTDGKVYLGLDGREGNQPHDVLLKAKGVEKHWFAGQHPAGNVGVQIHHIAPIRGNATVWTLKIEDLLVIGKLFRVGIFDTTRIIGITGGQIIEPILVRTKAGASVSDLLKGRLNDDVESRIILGNVLSGETSGEDDFLGVKYNMITAIKEGDYYELFGWLLPIKPRPSFSGTFPNFLFKNHRFEVDTNTHGELRAFVMTGQYEKVLPMDIYPQHLMKAIMIGDIERMEALGINELSEEDVALAEFSCTSKMPLQSILRDGLEMMREQA